MRRGGSQVSEVIGDGVSVYGGRVIATSVFSEENYFPEYFKK